MGRDEPRLRCVDHFETAGDARAVGLLLELEGVISKRLDAPTASGAQRGHLDRAPKCRAGTRGGDRRLVPYDGQRLPPADRGVHRDGKLVHVGRIGTGFGRDKVARLLPSARRR